MTKPDKFPGTPDDAKELLDTILDPDFLKIECEFCGKMIDEHSSEEIQECASKL